MESKSEQSCNNETVEDSGWENAPNESKRLQLLKSFNILDTEPEVVFDDITRLVASLCDVPIAVVSLIDKNRQWWKSRYGITGTQMKRDPTCYQAINWPREILEVPDILQDKLFDAHPLVKGEPHIRFYCAIPLVYGGYTLGSLILMDTKPRKLTPEQKSDLCALAELVVSQIANRNEALKQHIKRGEAGLDLVRSTDKVQPNHEVLETPADNVIQTLKKFQNKLGQSDKKEWKQIIDLIGSHRLYSVNVSEALNTAPIDADTKDFLISQLEQTIPRVKDSEQIRWNSEVRSKLRNVRWRRRSTASIGGDHQHSERVQPPVEYEDWGFNVFQLRTHFYKPLMNMGYHIIEQYGLIEKLSLDKSKLMAFLEQIEDGYMPNPYHNQFHAIEVLLNCHYFLTTGGLKRYFGDHQILAILLAAIIHDYKHPGVSNEFLVKTGDDLALAYNDVSVLENFHSSEAFFVLRMDEFNFFHSLSEQDYADVRKLIITLVLATDMGNHCNILNQFQNKLTTAGFDFSSQEENILILKMIIKCADLGNAAKPSHVYRMWADLLMEEFFRQGDLERYLNIPISTFMDRHNPSPDRCQIGFISYIANPTFKALGNLLNMDHLISTIEENLTAWQQPVQSSV